MLARDEHFRLRRPPAKRRNPRATPLFPGFSQVEENRCDYVSIKSRETPSNTAITLFVSP